MRLYGNLIAGRVLALAEDAVIMRRAGGFEVERQAAALVINPVEGFLVLLRRKLLVGQLLAAAGRHQQERVEGDGADFDRQPEDVRQLRQVDLCHRCVDLKLDAGLLRRFDTPHDLVKGAGHTAEIVVCDGSGAIDAKADAVDAGLFQPARIGLIEQRAARRHHHLQALLRAVAGYLVDVLAQHRIAAGEDDDRLSRRDDLVDHLETFLGGKLAGIGSLVGGGAAVPAGKIAAPGHLPGHEAWHWRPARIGASRAAVGMSARDIWFVCVFSHHEIL